MKRDEISIQHGRERSGLPWLPENVAQYFNEHHCTLEISICHTDVECGYGVRITKCFRVLRPYCKCSRCGYHSLWNPDDSNSKCLRHSYTRGWDTVFSYSLDTGEKKIAFEAAFDVFLSKQPKQETMPVIPVHL